MSLIVVMAVWNEAELLLAALDSLLGSGVDAVHIYDGAWQGGENGSHVFGGALEAASTDRTRELALAWRPHYGGPHVAWHGPGGKFWPSQEAKRTAMFHDSGAGPGDHLFVMDADETLEGRFPDSLPDQPASIMVRCVGPNDLPGIRGEWPLGDYCADFKPELRLFPWRDDLECAYPGGYWWDGAMVRPYTMDGLEVRSRVPVLEGITMDHHGGARSAARLEAKRAYYEAEHPIRHAWQKALHAS